MQELNRGLEEAVSTASASLRELLAQRDTTVGCGRCSVGEATTPSILNSTNNIFAMSTELRPRALRSSVPAPPPAFPSQRETLFIAESNATDPLSQHEKKLERVLKKLQISAEKIKAIEKEEQRTWALAQKNEEAIQHLLENQKADRSIIGALRKEVCSLQKQLAVVEQRNAERAHEMERVLGTQASATGSSLGADEMLFEVLRRVVDARLVDVYARVGQEVKRACVKDQAEVLKSWSDRVSAAVEQRSNAAADQFVFLREELANLARRQTATEKATRASQIEAVGPQQLLEHSQRISSQQIEAAIGTLMQRLNTTSAMVQMEQQQRLASVQASLDDHKLALEAVQAKAIEGHKKIRAKMEEFISGLAGLASMRQSVEVILEELERREQSDAGKDQALMDMFFNFQEFAAGIQELQLRMTAVEERRVIRNVPSPAPVVLHMDIAATAPGSPFDLPPDDEAIHVALIDAPQGLGGQGDSNSSQIRVSLTNKKEKLRGLLRQM